MQVEDVDGNPVDNPKLALIELICIAYFTVEFLLRLAGAPQKIAFLKNTMNIVDCAAILPYYITLFVMPQDNFGSIPPASATAAPSTTVRRLLQLDTNTEDSLLTTVEAAEEAEEGGFGNISRIMQVQSVYTTMAASTFAIHPVTLAAGVQDREDHEDLQAGPQVGGLAGHGPHGAHQLEGPGPAVHAGGHGHARVRQPPLLHRDQRGGHQLRLHTGRHVVGSADPHLARLRRLLARSALSH